MNASSPSLREYKSSNKTLTETQAKLPESQIGRAVDLALMRAKAAPEGMDLLADRLAKRITIESVDGRDMFRIADKDGKPMTGSGSDGLANFDDLAKEVIAAFPMLFEGSGRGGGGASGRGGRGNGLGPKTILRSEFERLSAGDRMAKVKAGFTVVGG